jgi:uncharacterized protein
MAKYHMNKKEKEITDQEEIIRILNEGKYAVIAMCRDNEPYIVTLSYGYDGEKNSLYFHSAKEGLKLDFINDNHEVCATVIEDKGYQKDNCSHSYSSVVMFGKMSLVEDLSEKKLAMDIILNHLEENPEPIKQRNFKDDKMYEHFSLLKLEISEKTGKSGS